MEILIVGIVGLVCFLMGIFALFGYMIWRCMRNEGWDDSNMTNALRLLSHVVLHPNDFGKMYYLDGWQLSLLRKEHGERLDRPFWYVSEDEFEGVVKTRPQSMTEK